MIENSKIQSNSVVIIDDHVMMRNGLKGWLEKNTSWKTIGVASTLEQVKEVFGVQLPEICIIDIQLGDVDGFDLLEYITANYPEVKSVMYSMYDTTGYVSQAKLLGARGYVSKTCSEEELAKCLKIVQDGGIYIEEKMMSSQQKIDEIVAYMTKRERRIFEEILKGKSNEQIAENQKMSIHSIECYVSRIYDVTGIRNREQLISQFC